MEMPGDGDGLELGPWSEPLVDGAVVMHGFASANAEDLHQQILAIAELARFRRMRTPGGRLMAVAMTSCGGWGWISDAAGYRYSRVDPDSGHPWPAMPASFHELARRAAASAGFRGFDPDSCLINRYEVGSGMTLHQDIQEEVPEAPVVSVSLGISARFRFGGATRGGPTVSRRLDHGTVVVWGGPARFAFHGIDPLRPDDHPLTGPRRYNLTFRRVRR